MSKTTNRVLSMVLTVLMLCSMLTVFAVASATPFAETYDGTVIPKTALLVDVTITEAYEATVTRTWDGKEYTFVVGTNAFASLADAYTYAKDNEIEQPAIIVTGWEAGAALTVEVASDVYAPNWNTVPMDGMGNPDFDALESDGANWTANETYAANEIKIGDFIVNGDVDGDVSINGFTLSQYIKHDNLRTAESGTLNTVIKNCKMKGESTNSNTIKGTGNTDVENEDTLTFVNFWLDTIGGTSTGASRFFGDNTRHTPNIKFDGLYVDFSVAKFLKANDHLKAYARHTSMEFVNSNLRRSASGNSPYWQFAHTAAEIEGEFSRTLKFDNNILFNTNQAGGAIYLYEDGFSKVDIVNNFVAVTTANSATALPLITTNGTAGKGLYSDDTITVRNNKLLGIKADLGSTKQPVKVTADSNFLVTTVKENIDGYKVAVGENIKSSTGLTSASTGVYYADYAMQFNAAGISVTGVETLGVDSIDGFDITILYEGTPDTKLTTESFTTGDAGERTVTKTLSTVADFSTTIEEYDVSTLLGTQTLYLKVAYDETYYNVYTLSLYDTEVESFNDKLADGLEINGVEFTIDDTAVYLPKNAVISEVGDELVTYLKFAGATYKFVVDNENVFENEAGDLSALDSFEGLNIVFPAGDYNSVTLTVAANYYGANFGVDPIDKSGATAANNFDWAINNAWDLDNDSVFYQIGVAAGITGEELVIDGVTVSLYVDNARTGTSEALYATIINSVFEAYNGNTGNPDAVIHLNNARATTTDTSVAEENDDSFTAKNVYFKSLTTNQLVHERTVPNVTFDNVYLDAAASGKKRAILGFFKTNQLIPAVITFKNSNFRNGTNANNLFLVAGATAGATNTYAVGDLVEVVIDNNIVYNGQGVNAVPMIVPNVSSVGKLDVTNNTFIDTTNAASLFGTQNYGNAADPVLKGNITIDGNTFVGFAPASVTANFGFGDNNPVMTNTYYSSTVAGLASPATTTGEYSTSMGSNDYWLDFGKTVKASELKIVDAQPGTSDVLVSTVAEETKSFIVTLGANRTTAGMAITLGDKATGKLLNANREEIAAATEAGTYFYRVLSTTTPTVFVDYEVTVLGAPAEPFISSYNLDGSGEILASALLVDTSITEAAGTVIERKWDGVFYKFTVGSNAFASLDAAYAYVGDADLPDAQIIVTNFSGQMIVKQPYDIYGPNWNTVPMNEMGDMTKVGVNANGVDWTDNAAYAEKELKITDVIFAGGFECEDDEIVKVTGFTLTGFISTDAYGLTGDLVRVPGETINAQIENFVFDSNKFIFDHHYTAASNATGAAYLAEDDTLVVKNSKYKHCGTRFWNGDGAVPANLVIDGLYVDFETIGIPDTKDGKYNTFMKKAGAHATTVIKNSNLRGEVPGSGNSGVIALAAWSGASYNYDEAYGYSYDVTIDNNTLTFGSSNAVLVEGTTDQYARNYRQLYFEGGRFTGLSITNNYMDRKGDTEGRIYASNPANVGGQLPDLIPGYEDTVPVFTGNRVVGYPLTSKFANDDRVEAYGNYFSAEVREDGNYVGVPGSHPVKHTGGFTDNWFYYLDYDMTIKSNEIYDTYSIVDAGKNMVVSKPASADEEGEIIYAYDDKVVNTDGTITVDFAHVIEGVHENNKATIYTADASADVETEKLTLVADANGDAEFKLSVWSHDMTKAITWTVKIQAPVHAWGQWTVADEATCHSLAVEKRVCNGADCMINDNCTEFETREVGEFADHKFENYAPVSSATCEAAGQEKATCAWCTEEDLRDNANDPKKDHAGEKHDGEAESCTTDGYKDYYECTEGCGKFYADADFTVVIEDLDAWKAGEGKIPASHKLDKKTGKTASCDAAGWKDYYECSVCGKFFADEAATTEIADLEAWKTGDGKLEAAHATVKKTGKAASCTEDGWKDYYECSGCHALFADEAATKAITDLEAWKIADGKIAAGHTWGEYVYNNDATTEADGTKTAKCVNCDATDTVVAEGTKLDKPVVEIKDTSKIFKDVKAKKWYTEAIDYAYSYGFIAGMSDTEFGLNANVTRGMFITILARIAGVETTGAANKITTKFTDVKSGKWYAAAIKWANDNGIVNGTSATTFGPDNAISRQDLCVMLVNYAKFMNVELTAAEAEISFKDASSIKKYAKEAVKVCQMADIVNGYANGDAFDFKPTNTATRAEAAVILCKFHSNFMVK